MVNGYAPETLKEALEIRQREHVTPYGGGTDLMVEHKRADTYLFLHRIPELKTIQTDNTHLRIGASCIFTQIAEHPETPEILKEAIKRIAAPAIRNLGTIGGNIGNGSAKADSVLILFALDAELLIQSSDKERLIQIKDFYKGRKELDLAQDELIIEIRIPRAIPTHYTYHKIGARAALAISRLSFAGLWTIEDGTITACATAFGAIEQTVVRKPEIDQILIGTKMVDIKMKSEHYLNTYQEALNPIDGRISAAYRKTVCMNLLRDFIQQIKNTER